MTICLIGKITMMRGLITTIEEGQANNTIEGAGRYATFPPKLRCHAINVVISL
jgi:hypothetical protein